MTCHPVSRARRRLADVRADGDRGSLALAMLVTLVATSIAALVLPMFVSSANAARFDDHRARQLAAAQSGVEVTLARIRAAAGTTGTDGANGLRQLLPCDPIVGTVLGETSLRYRATVQYFAQDPAVQVVSALTCVAGAGPSTAGDVFPRYARITAVGTDATGTAFPATASRSVSATYVVQTTNANIVGGLFRVDKLPTSKDLCLDAGSATPVAGTPLQMRECNAALASQKWAYNATLTVSLVATRSTGANGAVISDGLCVDGGSPGREASGTPLRLQACGTTTNLTQQRWSMNDTAGMQGTDDGATLNSLCWTVASADTVGSAVTLGTQCSGTGGYDNVHSWQPEASVGAGASGAAYQELVDYQQFGRCLDVTNQNVGSSYLIAWPCKQQPDPTKVAWNQRWTLPAVTNGVGTGQVSTTTGGTRYCLTSPLSSDRGRYVTVTACPATVTDATRWTVRTQVASYAASYQLEDGSGGATRAGLCLQPTDAGASPPDLATEGTGISKIVVAPCTESLLQKWNAPPNIGAPTVRNQTEN